MHRSPVLLGLDRHSWRLCDIGHCIPWMHQFSVPGVCKLLKRLKIVYKRGRRPVHSPDLEYNPKMNALEAARQEAQEKPGEVVLL